MFKKPTEDELRHRYTYHPTKPEQVSKYESVRNKILETAILCVELTPCSPEQSRALNALDEAMMLFNAAIARNS